MEIEFPNFKVPKFKEAIKNDRLFSSLGILTYLRPSEIQNPRKEHAISVTQYQYVLSQDSWPNALKMSKIPG